MYQDSETTASDGTGSRTMTKEEAIAALLRGEKLTHRCFQTEEWMRLEHGKVIFEDGASIYWDTFWDDRRSEAWQTNWSIFTPIVPSPDSVKDMGEVHTANSFIGHYLKRTAIEESLTEVLNEIFHKEVQPTAARLEEVTRELQDERRTKEGLIDANAKTLERLGEVLQRYREALRALTYDYRAHCNGVETPGLYRAESLLLGATEQSTEQ